MMTINHPLFENTYPYHPQLLLVLLPSPPTQEEEEGNHHDLLIHSLSNGIFRDFLTGTWASDTSFNINHIREGEKGQRGPRE